MIEDIATLRNKVSMMSDSEKNMFRQAYRKQKGWSVEDEQNAIMAIKQSGLLSLLKDINSQIRTMMAPK